MGLGGNTAVDKMDTNPHLYSAYIVVVLSVELDNDPDLSTCYDE